MTKTYQRGPIIKSGTTSDFFALSANEAPLPLVHGKTLADGPWTTLARLAHVSDLHITDTESPARLDFLTDIADDPRYEQPLPTLRPQQLTSTHAAVATLRTIDRMSHTDRLDCVVLTGDVLDNGQTNELDRLVTMIRGGTIATGTAEGTQSDGWTGSKVWRPSDPENFWSVNYGFPSGADILAAISRPIEVRPLRLPVMLARGNHDALLAGTVAWTPTLARHATGDVKARALPTAQPLHALKQRFYSEPEIFFTGTAIRVTSDDGRRPVADDGFPRVFNGDAQSVSGNDYFARLNERLAIVVLDTLDPAGHPAGVVSVEQASWLQDTLTTLESEAEEPVVIVASHHGPRDHHVTRPAPGRLTGPDVVALLGHYKSVALWLTGHTHVASTTLHQPDGKRGFWEVTASSIVDWPAQFQTIELLENPCGAIAVVVQQHHYDATSPTGRDGMTSDLAGLHLLLTANQAGFGRIFPGPSFESARDRVLQLGAPEHRG